MKKMNKLGHILFATLIFVFLYMVASTLVEIEVEKVLVAYIVFIGYTLLPDIDKNNSWIRKQLDKIILLLLIVFVAIGLMYNNNTAFLIAIALLIAEIVLTLIKHRGFVHSLAFGIMAASPLLFLGPIYFFSGVIGVVVHLIADGMM